VQATFEDSVAHNKHNSHPSTPTKERSIYHSQRQHPNDNNDNDAPPNGTCIAMANIAT
jgi:hypothetical protein